MPKDLKALTKLSWGSWTVCAQRHFCYEPVCVCVWGGGGHVCVCAYVEVCVGAWVGVCVCVRERETV